MREIHSFIFFKNVLVLATNWQIDEKHQLQPPPIQHIPREKLITLLCEIYKFYFILKAKMRGIEIDKNYSRRSSYSRHNTRLL